MIAIDEVLSLSLGRNARMIPMSISPFLIICEETGHLVTSKTYLSKFVTPNGRVFLFNNPLGQLFSPLLGRKLISYSLLT